MAAGQDVTPNPGENAEYHLGMHLLQYRTQAAQAALGPEGTKRLEQHILATQQLLRTQQLSMAMQQRTAGAIAGPQAVNAQVGRTAPQAPTTRSTGQPAQQPGIPNPVMPAAAGGRLMG